MPTKKKTTAKKSELTVSVSKKSSKKGVDAVEAQDFEDTPKTKLITKKYLYTVVIILALIGLMFAASRYWIVAWVDNKPITKFELYALLEKRDDGKTAEELIVERLLLSEGQQKKLAISNAEVDEEIKKIEEQQGGAEQLNQILSIQRLSREDFNKLVKLQLLKQKLFGGDINITDEDVKKYIEENRQSLPVTVLTNPESSEAAKLNENIKEQLKQLKVNDNFNKWLEEGLKSSRVSRT